MAHHPWGAIAIRMMMVMARMQLGGSLRMRLTRHQICLLALNPSALCRTTGYHLPCATQFALIGSRLALLQTGTADRAHLIIILAC